MTFDYGEIKRRFGGIVIANNGFDGTRANAAIAEGRIDLVAFGKPFISNPDLVTRLYLNAPLAPANRETFYGGADQGYTDYPLFAVSSRIAAIATTQTAPGGDGLARVACARPRWPLTLKSVGATPKINLPAHRPSLLDRAVIAHHHHPEQQVRRLLERPRLAVGGDQ